jgi:Reverse transcriptase (RNA-dependent DNA polymerase)
LLTNLIYSIASELSRDINRVAHEFDNLASTEARFQMSSLPVSSTELLSVVHELKDKKTLDFNSISTNLIKHTINGVSCPLIHVFNWSLVSGIVPLKMKVAKIVPIYKSGDPCDINNYRPISLLCTFSKIFEKIVANRLTNYLVSNNLISSSQYGFRAKHSTIHPMIHLLNRAATALNNKKHMLIIFSDLRKAFDTCDINILLKKLFKLGIQGKELEWFKSYLSDRSQFVD